MPDTPPLDSGARIGYYVPMPTTHRPSPYDLAVRPDTAHDSDRQGPSCHGYPVLRLEIAWGDYIVKTADGSEFVCPDAAIDQAPSFCQDLLNRLPFNTLCAWSAGRTVTVHGDGCVTIRRPS